MSRPVKQYVCVVDGWRRPSRQRSTAGRYRVAARDGRHARELLQKAIGFGSVKVYYEIEPKDCRIVLPLGQCRKEMPDGRLVPVRHATDPMENLEFDEEV